MVLNGFEEITVEAKSEINISIMHVVIAFKIRYFLNNSGIGYCSLLIKGVRGKGLRGMMEAAAVRAYIGRNIYVFLSVLENGKKLITVPALFEKDVEPKEVDDFIINTYYHNNLNRLLNEVYEEHKNALNGRALLKEKEYLRKNLMELPEKGIEILRTIR